GTSVAIFGPKQIIRSTNTINHADLMIPSNVNRTLSIPFLVEIPSDIGSLPPTFDDPTGPPVPFSALHSAVMAPPTLGKGSGSGLKPGHPSKGTVAYTLKVTVSWVEGLFSTRTSRVEEVPVIVGGMSPELKK
ncbi:hypothetical protein HK405_013513, partial [Cladochytrium tenue]